MAQFSIESFLSSAGDDLDLLSNQAQIDFLSDNTFKSPWIHRVEFRARTNNWDISQDDYRLRFSPTNPGEIKANKYYYQVQIDVLQSEYQVELNKALYVRYELLIEHLMLQDLLTMVEEEINIQNDILLLERNNISGSKAFLDKILDEEERLADLVLRKNDLQYDLTRNEYKIKAIYPFQGTLEIDRNALLKINGIASLISVINNTPDTINVFEAYRNKELLLENQRYSVEKAENRRNIGYFQLEYDRFRGDVFDDHMGFQVGVRIPITNPDRPDLNRRMMDIVGEEAEASGEKEQLTGEQELTLMDLENSIDQLKQFEIYLEQKKTAFNTDNYCLTDVDDILAILKIKKVNLRLYKSKYSIISQIYQQYFDWLYINGKLVQYPLINYLDKDLSIL